MMRAAQGARHLAIVPSQYLDDSIYHIQPSAASSSAGPWRRRPDGSQVIVDTYGWGRAVAARSPAGLLKGRPPAAYAARWVAKSWWPPSCAAAWQLSYAIGVAPAEHPRGDVRHGRAPRRRDPHHHQELRPAPRRHYCARSTSSGPSTRALRPLWPRRSDFTWRSRSSGGALALDATPPSPPPRAAPRVQVARACAGVCPLHGQGRHLAMPVNGARTARAPTPRYENRESLSSLSSSSSLR